LSTAQNATIITGMNQDLSQGIELHRAQRSAEAIPFLERATQGDDPTSRATALNHLGAAQFAAGHFEDAIATFRSAIEQTPGKPRLHCNLGNALIAVGRPAEAKREYEAALKLDPEYPEAKQGLVVAAADMVVGADNAASALAAEAVIPNVPLAPSPTPAPRPVPAEPPAAVRNGHAADTQTPPPVERVPAGAPASRPAAEADAAGPRTPPAPDASESLRHIAGLGDRVREARATLEQTQRLVAEQQETLDRLTRDMLSALADYQAEQEEAIRNAALKQAQALLTNAAAAAAGAPPPPRAAAGDNAVSLWQELPSSVGGGCE
jgi:tetratricopeptide (TPR) repeat protein